MAAKKVNPDAAPPDLPTKALIIAHIKVLLQAAVNAYEPDDWDEDISLDNFAINSDELANLVKGEIFTVEDQWNENSWDSISKHTSEKFEEMRDEIIESSPIAEAIAALAEKDDVDEDDLIDEIKAHDELDRDNFDIGDLAYYKYNYSGSVVIKTGVGSPEGIMPGDSLYEFLHTLRIAPRVFLQHALPIVREEIESGRGDIRDVCVEWASNHHGIEDEADVTVDQAIKAYSREVKKGCELYAKAHGEPFEFARPPAVKDVAQLVKLLSEHGGRDDVALCFNVGSDYLRDVSKSMNRFEKGGVLGDGQHVEVHCANLEFDSGSIGIDAPMVIAMENFSFDEVNCRSADDLVTQDRDSHLYGKGYELFLDIERHARQKPSPWRKLPSPKECAKTIRHHIDGMSPWARGRFVETAKRIFNDSPAVQEVTQAVLQSLHDKPPKARTKKAMEADLESVMDGGRRDERNVDRIKGLVAEGIDLEARDKFGNTPLLRACARADRYLIKALLDAGADPRAINQDGHNAINLYTLGGSNHINFKRVSDDKPPHVLERLLRSGIDLNAMAPESYDPHARMVPGGAIGKLVKKINSDGLQDFLTVARSSGADFGAWTLDGAPLVISLCRFRDYEHAALLLNNGARHDVAWEGLSLQEHLLKELAAATERNNQWAIEAIEPCLALVRAMEAKAHMGRLQSQYVKRAPGVPA